MLGVHYSCWRSIFPESSDCTIRFWSTYTGEKIGYTVSHGMLLEALVPSQRDQEGFMPYLKIVAYTLFIMASDPGLTVFGPGRLRHAPQYCITCEAQEMIRSYGPETSHVDIFVPRKILSNSIATSRKRFQMQSSLFNRISRTGSVVIRERRSLQ